ncbi:hypothetical protein [Aeromonas popoffii]|uniref:hypothetical protein n=1 Tax=Aeromonas popoffii TaxID=70856 RepID=UPI0005AA98E3|nr:hypothetical protein [Aeromonas popoffii]
MTAIENVSIVITTILITGVILFFLNRKLNRNIIQKLRSAESQSHEIEKKFHIREREFLNEKNQIAIDQNNAVKIDIAKAFEEGRLLGKSEGQYEHVHELTKQREKFSLRLSEDIEEAVSDAKEKLRAEYALQTKLFSVKISPYYKIGDDKGWVKTQHDVNIGYQYQLLINGIPAFQPHIVIERSESISEINEDTKAILLNSAIGLAEAAISTYLGINPQFARLAPAITIQKSEASIKNTSPATE